VASSQLLKVLEAVAQLDRTLARLLGHVDLFKEAPTPEVIESLARLAPAVVAAMREVREQLIAQSDDQRIEAVERALRARATVVMAALDELRAVEHERSAASLANTGRYRSVAELSRVLTERIGRINASLARKRRDLRGVVADARRSRALFHVALDNAEFGYAALGADPDVLGFLRAGVACESERTRLACRTIAIALDAVIVADTDRGTRAEGGGPVLRAAIGCDGVHRGYP